MLNKSMKQKGRACRQAGFAPILLVILAIIVMSVVVSVVNLKKQPQNLSKTNIETVPTLAYEGIPDNPLPTLRKVPFNIDPQDQWQTYTDTDRKYSFKYPSLLEFEKEASGIILTYNGPTQKYATEFYDGLSMSIVTNLNEDGLTPSEWVELQLKNSQKPPVFQQSVVRIGGKEAVKVYLCGLGCHTIYTVPSGSYMLSIRVSVGGEKEKEYENLSNQILSTFHFTQ